MAVHQLPVGCAGGAEIVKHTRFVVGIVDDAGTGDCTNQQRAGDDGGVTENLNLKLSDRLVSTKGIAAVLSQSFCHR